MASIQSSEEQMLRRLIDQVRAGRRVTEEHFLQLADATEVLLRKTQHLERELALRRQLVDNFHEMYGGDAEDITRLPRSGLQ